MNQKLAAQKDKEFQQYVLRIDNTFSQVPTSQQVQEQRKAREIAAQFDKFQARNKSFEDMRSRSEEARFAKSYFRSQTIETPRAPTACLIWKNADGTWKTVQTKEDPKAMSAGIAIAIAMVRAACKHPSVVSHVVPREALELSTPFTANYYIP